MIAGLFHKGSGLGNQLHRYVGTRCLALDRGEDFTMVAPELFKGSFMNLDTGVPLHLKYHIEEPAGKVIVDDCPEEIEIVDGEFQGEKDFIHHIDEVRDWLQCEPQPFRIHFTKQEDICVLNVRGGEYRGVPSLFLPKEYWYRAMDNMRAINPRVRFAIVTDDPDLCCEWFPNFPIRHDEGDWSAIKEAHYLILSNSSFAILPAILNENAKKIIAPWGWARHNEGYWMLEENRYKKFTYQDREGNLHQL